ncbi:DoxX family protein [Paenibacillus roseipurpureus]|uniref:DoxX family protein n=1 Tax=Paenibacillus roseopurpureus TaxID=2918901 RepID=A0AA96RIA8_9BACL|nr:DoxX family protein [Paenibacillus sp. MBLB1832]WNR42575.1 DoxX family protein [Paenibacillus sp. MBLB1832]
MRRKFSPIEIAIGVLIAIGLLMSLKALFIPIIVLGAIFLLYKLPPSRWKKTTIRRGPERGKTKNAKFRVINGNKDHSSDDYPKYH